MNIAIVSHFGSTFSDKDNDRFLYLANMIHDKCNVEIITSDFCHEKKEHRSKPENEWPFDITFLHETGYPKNICLRRFYSHFVWGINLKKYFDQREKPDAVYCAVPSLTGPYLLAKYCKKNDVKFVIDVQDLWPEAFKMVFNIPVISDLIFKPFEILANGIYKNADEICAVSDTYCDRAFSVNKKCKDTTTVFLGTDISVFDGYSNEKSIIDKAKNEIWLAYCGTLGSSYDLTVVIDALALLNNDNVRLVAMGDGPKEQEFKDYAKKKKIKAAFTGRLKYNQMCSLLKNCDITINPIVHNAAQSIINKHADYAASGLPVLSTQESEEYRKLVEKYNMGFNCRNNDAEDLCEKIKMLINDDELRKSCGKNARKCAEEKFDRKNSYKDLIEKIF